MSTLSDEMLDRMFRAANPATRPETSGLTAAEIAVREKIIRGARPRTSLTRRGWALAGLPAAAAAAAVAVLVAVNVLSPGQQASALGPPPLDYAPAGTLSSVISTAEGQLLSAPDVAQESRVSTVGWAWNVDMSEKQIEIVPQDVVLEWTPGGTARTVITAGVAYWTADERPDGLDGSPYKPGEVIDTIDSVVDESWVPASVAELNGVEGLEPALAAFGAGGDSSSGEVLAAITGLQQYWTLDDAQQAALLDILVDAGEVTVRGETEDRLGRPVIGLTVSSSVPERVETLFISTETGRLAGVESELVGPLDGLPAGVISYTMWDADDD
ncbi:hypothetical protein ACI3KS_07010 [Microbacterium sp. ZW T5_45]|uniref:hypothetical protein n=1 Tax=Microbacterium sp. ZW T5_45 TaxID=3378080 RepID=UPI003853733B